MDYHEQQIRRQVSEGYPIEQEAAAYLIEIIDNLRLRLSSAEKVNLGAHKVIKSYEAKYMEDV